MSLEQAPIHTPASRILRKEKTAGAATHLCAYGIAAFPLLAMDATRRAAAQKSKRTYIALAPLAATSISSLRYGRGIVMISNIIGEMSRNRLIIQDKAGRALIETGPASDEDERYTVDHDGTTGDLRPHPSLVAGVDQCAMHNANCIVDCQPKGVALTSETKFTDARYSATFTE